LRFCRAEKTIRDGGDELVKGGRDVKDRRNIRDGMNVRDVKILQGK
jgi:hypothetical protein